MRTCRWCRNVFTDEKIVAFIDSDSDGFCPVCRYNAQVGEMTEQPNVGVAPITTDVVAGEPAATGYEAPATVMPVGQIPITITDAAGDTTTIAITPQVGNEAYQQGLPPTGTP